MISNICIRLQAHFVGSCHLLDSALGSASAAKVLPGPPSPTTSTLEAKSNFLAGHLRRMPVSKTKQNKTTNPRNSSCPMAIGGRHTQLMTPPPPRLGCRKHKLQTLIRSTVVPVNLFGSTLASPDTHYVGSACVCLGGGGAGAVSLQSKHSTDDTNSRRSFS